MGETKRVLVVDDSAFMRSLISDFLQQDPTLHVIATARNGLEAVRKVKELHPDVVTLDLEMPEMDGLSALQIIMRDTPVPVVIVSAMGDKDASITVKALAAGALDFVAKPSGAVSVDLGRIKDELIAKVRAAAAADVSRLKPPLREIAGPLPPLRHPGEGPRAVGIAASTGGPRAIEVLLTSLPRTLACPLFIVQHMPAGLTASFAERLSWVTSLEVAEAHDGEVPRPGIAYLAPGDHHMEVDLQGSKVTVIVHRGERVNSIRPSADPLFSSLARAFGADTIGVVLTGMGVDGARGLLRMREAGGFTMAQSAESCVVYGMPRAAIAMGAAEKILALEEIGPEILLRVGVRG